MIDNGILKPSGVIQLRGGTSTALTAVNPSLAQREICVETDTGKLKVGNGTDRWNDLPYSGSGEVDSSQAQELDGIFSTLKNKANSLQSQYDDLGVKLVLTFETSNGKNVIFTYNHAKPSATAAQVKALMNGIIANGSIFSTVPA